MNLVFGLTFFVLALSIATTFIRIVRGPHSVDRILCLDLLAIVVAAIVTLHAVNSNETIYLDAVLVLSIISFLSTIVFARYIERGPERRKKT